MLKSRNQTAVNHIAKRMMKGNHVRNRIAMLAIILTTFMFTTVFSIGISLAENMQVMQIRQQGTMASVFLAQPSEKQIEDAKDAAYLHAAGIRVPAGCIELEDGKYISIDYYDETEFEENYKPAISHVKGSYPKKADEIMLSQSAMKELEVESVRIGEKITLGFNGETRSFRISGWFQDYEFFSDGSHVFVSEKYVEEKGLTIEENGILAISAEEGKQQELLKSLYSVLKLDSGQELETQYDIQTKNSSNQGEIGEIIFLLGIIIVASGYLLIYNVMYISVSKDIRFYGLLKTIGASPTQIKAIVRRQAWRLSIIGIPVGILLGTLMAFVLVPVALTMFTGNAYTAMPTEIRFRPLLYGGTIVFSMVTVGISCRKPANLAGSISPVEAVKYHGMVNKNNSLKKKKIRKKRKSHGGKPYKMAWRNIFRDKKRAILVFVSLFMGVMAFLSVHVFIDGLKLENYVKNYLPNDYAIVTGSDIEGVTDNEKIHDLVEKISAIRGVTKVQKIYSLNGVLDSKKGLFQPFIDDYVNQVTAENGSAQAQQVLKDYEKKQQKCVAMVVGADKKLLEQYNEMAYQPIDIEQFLNGEICLVGNVSKEAYADKIKGEPLTIQGDKGAVTVKIGAVATNDHGINLKYYWQQIGGPHYVIVSEKVIKQLSYCPKIDEVRIDCKEEAENYVTNEMKKLTENNPLIESIEVKSEQMQGFQSFITSMNVLSSGISMVLILIGILNFINVMLTGVYSRRKELAMLESIGMTKRQNRRMLVFEGLYYGGITNLLMLSLGSGGIFFVGEISKGIADYAVFRYPVELVWIMAAVIFLICTIVPVLVYKTVSRESVIERMRSIE